MSLEIYLLIFFIKTATLKLVSFNFEAISKDTKKSDRKSFSSVSYRATKESKIAIAKKILDFDIWKSLIYLEILFEFNKFLLVFILKFGLNILSLF